MSETTAPNAPFRYRGYNNGYVDIAVRKTDEHLGISLEYAAHPNGTGYFIVRFVAHGKDVDPNSFKHFTFRESTKFVTTAGGFHQEMFRGVRLNKLAVPVFSPAIHKHEVAAFADQFNVWTLLAEWMAEQVIAEGFTVTVPDLAAELRGFFAQPATAGSVTSVLELPKLDAPEAAALKLVKKQKPASDADEDGDDEDGDDDEKEPWLN